MAQLNITLPKDLQRKIDMLGNTAKLAPKMIKAAQNVVEPEVKRQLQSHVKSGALLKSVTKTKPKINKKGEWVASIAFVGKDNRGIANGQKALSLEYGTSKQLATPFIRPAKEATKDVAEDAMIDEIMKVVK